MFDAVVEESKAKSRPARALWIEIQMDYPMDMTKVVEAREGLVD